MMDMDLLPEQQQTMHVSPRLIAANRILELSAMELMETLEHELEQNPALEKIESITCPQCGSMMVDNTCHVCARADSSSRLNTTTFHASESYDDGAWQSAGQLERDDDFDPFAFVAAPLTLAERLLADLTPLLDSPEDKIIAEYLIGNLDDNGFLQCEVAEVTSMLGVSRRAVNAVIGLLQTLEPSGIGARDVQECLLIQLRYLKSQGGGHPLAYRIVAEFFPELGAHKYGHIAHALGVSVDEVIDAAHFVRKELNPYPGQQFRSKPRSAPLEIPRYVLPDIIIRNNDGNLEVEIVESSRFAIRISTIYQDMWRAVTGNASAYSEVDREHVRHYVSRAKMFMANINQRRQTMEKIGSFLADYQRDFLIGGVRYLKPLTRAMAASYIGMHESTVSRATAGKWVMIPSGHVIPFHDFFTPALNVKDVIKELINTESTPLTDQQIVTSLAERGYNVARRTVAKYRDQLGILPSSLRG